MRIAIYHNLPSGGGKRALYEMTRRLASKHEVDVYSLSCAEHDFCDLRSYCRHHVVFPFNPLPMARRPFGRLNQGIRVLDLLRLRNLQQQIAKRIDEEGYDTIFVHNCQYGQSPTILSFLQAPSVYYCNEPPRLIYEPGRPRPYAAFTFRQHIGNWFDPLPRFYRRVLAQADRRNVLATTLVLTNSAYSRESLYRTYGIFARICYLGVDAQYFRPLSLSKLNLVLSVGALNPNKGFDFLLHSLALIQARRRPCLVIVSNYADALERGYLEKLAIQLSVNVEFRTLISDDTLVRLYNQAMLTLYAPVMEPFGLVPLESMACGTPVVGVREGGVRESVLHGETGLLTERDPYDFAGAVGDLLDDPARRTQFGRSGRAYVERQWQWDRSVQDLERFLTQAAQAKPSGAVE